MEQDNGKVENQRTVLELKVAEAMVSAEEPWKDDKLNREEIASRLTNIVRNQKMPFVISIHGEWGTGKTFMLKRWQRDLEIQGFKAIYFNAWEDDFCDDPLLAILGQLAGHFKERGLKRLARTAAKVAIPLIRENALGFAKATAGVSLKVDHDGESKASYLDDYLEQKEAKNNLKSHLTRLSSEVSKKDEPPLVFIIDELDRCRPTFAIELLERVKHIFDVPNMVFVLGINRDELCKSLQSIYGEIDADVYLRRFFDLEFNLAAVDTAEYCGYLMRKLGIRDLFHEIGKNDLYRTLQNDVDGYFSFFPELWSNLGMSLRDMDYCVRSIALVGNAINRCSGTIPWILGLLISMKLKNPNLYRRYVRHECRSSEVIENIHDNLPPRDAMATYLRQCVDKMEGYLYRAEASSPRPKVKGAGAIEQLELLQKGQDLTHPESLSCKTRRFGSKEAGNLLRIAEDAHYEGVHGDVVGSLGQIIDLHQVRR